MSQVCLTAFQRKASGCVLYSTGWSLIPSDVWLHWNRDWQWQTLMGTFSTLLMYIHFSATPACLACKPVQLLAVKWPNTKNHTGKEKHSYRSPRCKSSCLMPRCIALHYILCLYVMGRQYSFTCIWKQTTYFTLLILLGAVLANCTGQHRVMLWWLPG